MSADTPRYVTPHYGRFLEGFEEGVTYPHPWEVTLDAGMLGTFQASFLDATPMYASKHFAKAFGFRDKPVHPLLLLNLGLSFSVHDVSEKAIAHLAYEDVRFPQPAYEGDTVTASSKVIGKRRSSSGDKGVVHVRTILENQNGDVVCVFHRKALVRAGEGVLPKEATAPATPLAWDQPESVSEAKLPVNLGDWPEPPPRRAAFPGYFEEFEAGQVFAHYNGKTVGDSEHMQLTLMMRNSHPIHFDEGYCAEGNSFKGTRVVYGGLVFGFVASLASRDTAGNAIWDLGWDEGSHPNGVVAGDTLYAASKVLETNVLSERYGELVIRLVGVKNERPSALIDAGHDLFTAERDKDKDKRTKAKVFEITRRLLVLRRG